MKRVSIWLLVILAPLAMLPQSRAESERELSRIRSRLAEVKKEIANLRREERGVLKEIELLQEQVTLTRRLMAELERTQHATRRDIDSLETSVRYLEGELEESKDNLRSHLVSLFKRGQFYDMELVFGAKSVSEIYDRVYFTRYAARAENRLFDRLLSSKHSLEAKEDSLKLVNQELARLIREKRAVEDSLVSARRSNQRRLNQIQQSQKTKQELERELSERKRQLERLLAAMNRESSTSSDRRPTGTVIEKGRGSLPWPTSSHKIIANYGTIVHPRYGTRTFNDGIEIDCSGGQSVKAINRGKVVYAQRLSGYGLLVIVDHQDGYYSIYSNLDNISVGKGQSVTQGQALGSSSDYLHFSITRADQFLNPIDYLGR